jgi:hypothetical protein
VSSVLMGLENLTLPLGLEPRIIQSITSRYTNYASLTKNVQYLGVLFFVVAVLQ